MAMCELLMSPLAALRSHARMSGLSDAVGGVHGGKYQFGPRGDAGFVGGAFADSLAASDSLSAGVQAGSIELWPTWATEVKRSDDTVPLLPVPRSGHARVRVTNIYRTWEPWFASIIPSEEDEGVLSAFVLDEPHSGNLAPRGGANNVCDVSKPYEDSVDLVVRRASPVGEAPPSDEASLLLIRTEEDCWLYRIVAAAETEVGTG